MIFKIDRISFAVKLNILPVIGLNNLGAYIQILHTKLILLSNNTLRR